MPHRMEIFNKQNASHGRGILSWGSPISRVVGDPITGKSPEALRVRFHGYIMQGVWV
nr:hypothetical protein BMMJLCPH_00004 [Gallid alphaherpesvirus 2]WOL21669.1 hypothetical protein BMMJLCPH_00094 [Gallid alphaherpesvirus 2]WOL21690.1 hypothetical protein DMEEGDKK_00004 [Gallid alphaherpesvirus 2]WOL21784.1 hypothetical protein DMEEGDKK_00098 [Gallid alphaherpesvirus 2]